MYLSVIYLKKKNLSIQKLHARTTDSHLVPSALQVWELLNCLVKVIP